jgi:hypothetical protein
MTIYPNVVPQNVLSGVYHRGFFGFPIKALGNNGLLDWNLDAGEKKWPWRLVLTPDIRGRPVVR